MVRTSNMRIVFDVENVLTMVQLTGRSEHERAAATRMAELLASTEGKSFAEVEHFVPTDATAFDAASRMLFSVLATNTSGRARDIVKDFQVDKNGVKAWVRLRDRFGKTTGATSFTQVFSYPRARDKPSEDLWREWVRLVSRLPRGLLGGGGIGGSGHSGCASGQAVGSGSAPQAQFADGVGRVTETG